MTDDWFEGGGNGSRVDVLALLDTEGVLEALGSMVDCGALVSIGCTRDGGALGITVTVDGRWRREYFREADELRTWLAEAIPAVRSACEALTASAARGSRQRRSRGL